jgi:hypothetical protein
VIAERIWASPVPGSPLAPGSGRSEITSQASPGTPLRRPLVNNLDVCRSGPYACSSNPDSVLERVSKCCGFSHHHHSCQAFRLARLHLERDPKRSSPPHFTAPTRASRSGLQLHPRCIQDKFSLIQPSRSPLFRVAAIVASRAKESPAEAGLGSIRPRSAFLHNGPRCRRFVTTRAVCFRLGAGQRAHPAQSAQEARW